MNRDGARKSIWQEEIKSFGSSEFIDEVFDVAVIGGGITGVSTAYRLQKSGRNCILIEAANIAFGTSGGTTAHLNDFFDTSFAEAIRKFGGEKAHLLKKCGGDAMRIIENNILDNNIQCDFEKKNAFVFALDEQQVGKLEDMVKGARMLGYEMKYTNRVTYPVPYLKAVEIKGQAQFHPVKYIKALCEAYLNLKGIILEGCICQSHREENDCVTLTTTAGIIKAKNLIYATHVPPGVNKLHFATAPYRSYVLAFTLKNKKYPEELGYDLEEPYRYYRVHKVNGEQIMIAGGEDHKTGHADDTGECFSKLENYVRRYFDVEAIKYSWSSQYYEPVDGLPFIGILPGSDGRIFTATGFRGNGMMFGSLSSLIITDLIMQGSNPYTNLFSPSRIEAVAGFRNFVKEQAAVINDYVKDKLFAEKVNSLAEIKEGEAKVIKFRGNTYAVYKEKRSKVHMVKSTCPHIGCEVRWNSAEISWDCPCHGSRFNVDGKLLTAPAVRGLARITEIEADSKT